MKTPAMTEEQVAELIDLVFRKGAYLKENERTVRRLAKLGRPALDALLKILKRPPNFEMDPRDSLDSVGSFLSAIAHTAPDAVLDRLDDLLNQGSTWLNVYHALGNAKGRRSLDVRLTRLSPGISRFPFLQHKAGKTNRASMLRSLSPAVNSDTAQS